MLYDNNMLITNDGDLNITGIAGGSTKDLIVCGFVNKLINANLVVLILLLSGMVMQVTGFITGVTDSVGIPSENFYSLAIFKDKLGSVNIAGIDSDKKIRK
ncbi:hypothetical protein CAXC1_330107 [Candidatus Xenohaliotis californiensis]|uniref:Uncharacterized protein n=1 Tax=Candidatus Xenohaliotis californiensis TaxID=84677 RepID=A0ABM9N8U1_9RICK|nr:hypothetical protein CAXC1_330107 [Candidatus Xenohaliotis californiensis]